MTMNNLLFSLLIAFSLIFMSSNCQQIFNVVDHGAIGDGQTDDTHAFKKVWEMICSIDSTNPTMFVRSGMTFLVQPFQFDGPCKSQTIKVEINGELIAKEEPSDWIYDGGVYGWIHFNGVDGLSIYGTGTINGRGQKWWQSQQLQQHPTALVITDATNVSLSGIKFKDNPRMHIVLDHVTSVTVSNIEIEAPEDSPNTDGIHLSHCSDVSIDQTTIGTGDDCISIVDGSSFIKISNITCGPGHGISIGSLGKNGATNTVENIEVRDIVFKQTMYGARIKTWQGGSGYARNILFEGILCQESDYPIIIDQNYCDKQNCQIQEKAVQVQNVTFRQVLGTAKGEIGVKLDCSNTFPCKDIVIDHVHILSTDNKNVSVVCNSVEGRIRGQSVPDMLCLNRDD